MAVFLSPVSLASLVRRRDAHLQANTPYIAESPHNRRHAAMSLLQDAMPEYEGIRLVVKWRLEASMLCCGCLLGKLECGANRLAPSMTTSPILSVFSSGNKESMNVKRVSTCLRLSRFYRSRLSHQRHGAFQRRNASTSSTSSASQAASPASPLASITAELDKLAPCFDIPADSIEIIRSPSDFFEALKVSHYA